MRLQVFLSRSRVCSRRKALEMVKEGRVSVGGKIIREPSFNVCANEESVYFDNKKVELKENSYLILNKPKGYITTLLDKHAKLKVVDLLPVEYKHLYPVGRLDRDTQGLLLFTNDGDLAFRLGHPSFKVDKTYLVEIEKNLKPEDALRLKKGVVIEGRRTLPARIGIIRPGLLEITIHEGRKRQIRLMLSSLGYNIRGLRRIKYGPLSLGGLDYGAWRSLTEPEISSLRKACGFK